MIKGKPLSSQCEGQEFDSPRLHQFPENVVRRVLAAWAFSQTSSLDAVSRR